jgi:hypothetical protein
MTTQYTIGDRIWFKGDRVTITTEPYTLYGGNWQDSTTDDGNTVTVPTPASKASHMRQERKARQRKQEAFGRIRERGQ